MFLNNIKRGHDSGCYVVVLQIFKIVDRLVGD